MGRRLLVALALLVAVSAWADSVELLRGLEEGRIWAQFWGGGDTGVHGRIGPNAGGPDTVTIEPGTQFWAQTSGRQGQTSLGRSQVGLQGTGFAQVWIPTACTNFNLRAPTEDDVMFAYACPNDDMARLAGLPGLLGYPRPSVQLAVWAIANDPPLTRLKTYLRDQVSASAGELTQAQVMEGAVELLSRAGLEPEAFRMFAAGGRR